MGGVLTRACEADTSTGGAPTSWLWNFGDGFTSTGQNPTHTYNKGGLFTVKLTATNSAGSDTESKTGLITVTGLVSKIAFQSDRDGNYEIYVMDADGSNVQRLTQHAKVNYQASWSPDGKRFAFDSTRDSNWDIYVMDADGSNVQRLTQHEKVDARPVWSQDVDLLFALVF